MQTEQITSIKDARVVEARELTSASGRCRLHKCLLEGVESIQWAMEAGMPIEHVFCAQRYEKEPLYPMLRERRIPCYLVSEGILKKISDTSYLVPYLGVTCIPEELSTTENMGDFVVVLDRVQDHGNIGTIIRTASAFGIRDLVSTTPTLDVYYKKIVSASRGKAFDVRIKRYDTGKGYMRYQSDDPNSVAITETGERILAQLWSVVERAEQAVLTGFSETEKVQFKAYLSRIQDNCMRVIETTEVQI